MKREDVKKGDRIIFEDWGYKIILLHKGYSFLCEESTYWSWKVGETYGLDTPNYDNFQIYRPKDKMFNQLYDKLL